jgi:hypothetical protein
MHPLPRRGRVHSGRQASAWNAGAAHTPADAQADGGEAFTRFTLPCGEKDLLSLTQRRRE